MDLGFSEEQKMLKESARSFLDENCPKSLVRQLEESESGYSPELWSKMADIGWMGLIFPEKYGGAGMSFIDLTVLITEMGRALVPGPFLSTVVYCGLPILWAGNDEQKNTYLPKISRGNLIMTLALTEQSARFDAEGVVLEAVQDSENEYMLNGTKLFVPDAHIADWFIVAVRTNKSKDSRDGISLFLVDAKTPGIKVKLLRTIASDKQAEVLFDHVRVPKTNILGELNDGWLVLRKMMQYAAVAHCAKMVGGSDRLLEMTVEYAKQRVQFDKYIGTFEVIQHRATDMLIDVDTAKLITFKSAWELSMDMDAANEVAMAKSWTGEAYRRVCMSAHQIHGGVGVTLDHDLQLYTRRAKADELAFGDADFHLKEVGEYLVTR